MAHWGGGLLAPKNKVSKLSTEPGTHLYVIYLQKTVSDIFILCAPLCTEHIAIAINIRT